MLKKMLKKNVKKKMLKIIYRFGNVAFYTNQPSNIPSNVTRYCKQMNEMIISLIGFKNLLTHLHIILFWSDTQYIFIYLMICLSLYIDTIHRNETAVSPPNLNKTRPVCKRVWTLCAALPAIVSLWVICVTTVREAWNTSVFIHSNVPSWKWKSPHIKHLTKNPYVIWLQADVLKSCDVWQVKYIMVIFVVMALNPDFRQGQQIYVV